MREQRVVALVQARMGSTRLPGKSMLPLKGQPIVELVLRRASRAHTVDHVVLATTMQHEDDILCNVAAQLGVDVYRGPAQDVLRRYFLAAREHRADHVVRVCADNPLVAPEEIDRVVDLHLRTGSDYAFNHRPAMENGYPNGLGAEVFTVSVLDLLHRTVVDQEQREHVTAFIWAHPHAFAIKTVVAPAAIAGASFKLDVDNAEDLARLQVLLNEAPSALETWSASSIIRACRKRFGEPAAEMGRQSVPFAVMEQDEGAAA